MPVSFFADEMVALFLIDKHTNDWRFE
ncbi:hypothetical protein SPV1_06179 [Mariprofundus ferrooxydans PV-1]|uniref:Uncharacterized protein n=1 Tax=Mariprofundus ferrooxydans PV-1 TaxID=314345 RepID=Q0EWT5_9PROT|nr:hypothetical protein SPV1_06179 [Mariprofundus ferrooxydans PV-1]